MVVVQKVDHCSWIVVSVEAEWQLGPSAERHNADTSEYGTDGKRLDQLLDETDHWDVPVVIATTSWVRDTRRVVQNDPDLRLFGTN